jgi:hypothetical protein
VRIRPRPFIIVSGIVLLVLACLFVVLYYYWQHPSAIKSQIEKSVSVATGTSLTLGELSFSFSPLRVHAKNIKVSPGKTTGGFELTVPELVGHFSLSGPFGRKVLSIEKIDVTNPSLSVFSDLSFPSTIWKPTGSSYLGRIMKPLAAYLVFREIDFQAAEAVNGTIVFRSADERADVTQINARLFGNGQLEVSCSAEINVPSKKLRFLAPQIHFWTDPTDSKGAAGSSTITGQLDIPAGSIQGPDSHVGDMRVRIPLAYDSKERRLTFEPATLVGEHLILKNTAGMETAVDGLQVDASGVLDLQANQLQVIRWHLIAGKLLEFRGNLGMGISPLRSITINLLDGRLVPRLIVPLVAPYTGAKLKLFDLAGSVRLKGGVDGEKGEHQWTWRCDLDAGFSENPVSYVMGQERLSGRISGNLKAHGSVPNLDYSVRMTSEQTTFSGQGLKLEPFEAVLAMSGKFPGLVLEELGARVPHAAILLGKNEYAVNTVDIRLRNGEINLKTGALFLPEIRFSSSLLKNVHASLTHRKEQASLILEAKDSHLLEAVSTLKLLPSDWHVMAQDSLTVRAVFNPGGWHQLDAKLEMVDVNFQDGKERCMGEKIRVVSEVNARIDSRNKKAAAEMRLEVDAGEILLDRFYMDFKENGLSLTGKGVYDAPEKSIQVSGLRLDLGNLLALELEGTLSHRASRPNLALFVKLPTTALSPLFRHFVSEPYKFEKPILESLQVGGVIAADLAFRRAGEAWDVKGHSTWHDGALSFGDKDVSFGDIELDLPVWSGPAAPGNDMESLKGRLFIGSMGLPQLPNQSLVFPLIARPGSLSVPSSTSIRFPVGKIQLGSIACKDIFSADRSVETSLIVDGVSIEPLLEKIWPGPVKGMVHGELGRINFLGNAIQSQGSLTADVFGGQIVVTDPGVASLFTAAPVLKLGVRLNNLSLAALTEGTSFGKIQGVLEGGVRDLEIVRGQPQRFDLWLETVQEKTVRQKISVEAVDNIARLGGGGSPFMGLAGRFVSLFKEFSYKKIGVRSSLENDVFTINGTIKEGGVEYLVKRSGFSGVNVVNLNPDNRASFKDMVKRIKRIKSSRQGPVVK